MYPHIDQMLTFMLAGRFAAGKKITGNDVNEAFQAIELMSMELAVRAPALERKIEEAYLKAKDAEIRRRDEEVLKAQQAKIEAERAKAQGPGYDVIAGQKP